jgi:hypothetical protein
MNSDLSEVRRASWATRRAKYGQSGHAGSYARARDGVGRRALVLVIQLHNEEVLSEGQCCKALDMDRIDFRILRDTVSAALAPTGGRG